MLTPDLKDYQLLGWGGAILVLNHIKSQLSTMLGEPKILPGWHSLTFLGRKMSSLDIVLCG